MVSDPDTELVVRAGKGDRAAAQALMARHLPKMLTLARRMLADRTEAEDVAQDVFLKVWMNAARWKPGQAKFETWLYRVTLNQCYDRLRRRPTVDLDAAMHIPDTGPAPDRTLHEAETAAEVERALAGLPERQRAAIILCHCEEFSNGKAAETLGISVEALESLLSRGRRTLRVRLAHLKDG